MPNPKGNLTSLTPYRPKWRSGQTCVIRVPVALTSKIMGYAVRLDAGWPIETKRSCKESLLHVIEKLEQVAQTPRNNFSKEKRELLQSAINEIQQLVTVNGTDE